MAPPETAQKGPRVDGALTTQPMALAVPPVRNTSASLGMFGERTADKLA